MKQILALLLCLNFSMVYAQVVAPPSLEVGLSQVLGTKGTIDIEVLADIIAEKQGELKKEFVKRSVLNHLENQSYVVWEYAYNSMDILLESKDVNAIKKNLLEHSTNLAAIYVFTEFYLQMGMLLDTNNASNVIRRCKDICGLPVGRSMLSEALQPADSFATKYILAELSQQRPQHSSFSMNQLLMDITFDILYQTKAAEELGLFKSIFPLGQDFYEHTNLYYRGLQTADSSKIRSLHKQMKGDLGFLMNNFLLIKQISHSDRSLEDLIGTHNDRLKQYLEEFGLPSSGSQAGDIAQVSDTLFAITAGVYDDLATIHLSDDNHSLEKELTDRVNVNLNAFSRFQTGGVEHFEANDLYWTENSIKPLLIELTTRYGFNPVYINVAEAFYSLISLQALVELSTSMDQLGLNGLASQEISEILEPLGFMLRLDELDFAETYELVLQTSNKIPDVVDCPDRSCVTSFTFLKTLTDNLKKYTLIDKDSNRVQIAVEDIILRLYEKLGNRQKKTIDFYFSIGVNQSISSDFKFNTFIPDSTGFPVDTVTSSLSSVAFASEKIGVKVKLINIKRDRNLEFGERHGLDRQLSKKTYRSTEPFVSDIYFLAYGSGLLYQLLDLRTDDNFDDPILGLGLGAAFFNAIDFNIGYNWPIKSDGGLFDRFSSEALWTVSFDVRISEYISRARKKRK